MVVLPEVNTTVLESNAISTFSSSLSRMDLRTAAGFLWRMKEHFCGAFASGVVKQISLWESEATRVVESVSKSK